MPYSTIAQLPSHIRRLPEKKQRQWLAVFNSVFSKRGEAAAFKAANAILVKESAGGGKDMSKKNGFVDFEFTSDLEEATKTVSINKEKGIVEGVVILTGEKVSKNKTFYTKQALQEAVTRYEGAKMFLDHPKNGESEVRSVRDFGGVYKNVRLEEGRYVKADLHLVPSNEIRNIVLPLAEAKPLGVGFSIRDRGRGREENGVFLVEGFASKGSFSIDLVTEASVNETLFESNQGGSDMDLTKVTLEELEAGNPTLVESIKTGERNAVLKEFEEKIKAGEEAPKLLDKSKKVMALAESGMPKEVIDKLRPTIESESISFEVAQGMIKAQKEILESVKAPAKGGDPKVTGHGASKDGQPLNEAELPSEDELARAIQG